MTSVLLTYPIRCVWWWPLLHWVPSFLLTESASSTYTVFLSFTADADIILGTLHPPVLFHENIDILGIVRSR
jgi:hypothetical protein